MGAARTSTSTAPHECVSLAREVSSDFSKAGDPTRDFPSETVSSVNIHSLFQQTFTKHLLCVCAWDTLANQQRSLSFWSLPPTERGRAGIGRGQELVEGPGGEGEGAIN